MSENLFECSPENAPRFWNWLHQRGGIARWESRDLSNPGKSFSTPALTEDGQPFRKPHWSFGESPDQVCVDPDQIKVITDREVERFPIALKAGSGLQITLTSGSSRKVRAALDKVAKQHNTKLASYHFDHYQQEVVITVPDKVITLAEWATQNPEVAEKALTGEV